MGSWCTSRGLAMRKARHEHRVGGRFRAVDRLESPGLCRPSRWVRGKAYLATRSPSVPVGRARELRLVDYAWKPLVGHRPREAPFRARLPSLTVQFSASALPACLSGSTLSHRSVAPRHTPMAVLLFRRLYRFVSDLRVSCDVCGEVWGMCGMEEGRR